MDGAKGPIGYPFATPPEPGEVVEIAPGVLWTRLPLPKPLEHVNVYILEDEDGWTVVDTGLDTRLGREIWGRLLAGPLAGRPVARVLATHHHLDHLGLAGWFQKEHGAELLATRTCWLMARMLTLDVQERPTEETLAFWRGAGMDPETYARRLTERPLNFSDAVHPMPLGFRRLKDGDRLRLAGRDWAIRTGDGHSPEHATLWSRDDALVITGDQVLPSISSNLGVYATEPDADPVGDWLASCERLRQFARGDQIGLCGHGRPFTGLPVRFRQLIDNHHSALERLLAALDEPKTAADCFPVLFKRPIGTGEYGLALVEAVGHMNHLHATGRVTRTRRADGAWLFRAV
ncbi:MBL fold metallo-hydrolase [Poseidonocella sedimentorum]|uniref:Glyoxylase, beta-lactamase superfamily II n=1 Tax=Poseidonocella sedimentorum TaxID=871652 RepID=A0A1I6EBK4_9RHOB|nr:MBL fold metallo-hydrolase [Poseidonocella sedimentorum]SFR14971.1 Glyoxylase, beta-lactamase superfamily II [Poseidonocella sedimentorum]